jgi:hypothetical protein
MDEFDNRIRFDAPQIDFTNDVGITGQAHDTYPAPKTPPLWDWMRMFLIGLLSLQSSDDPPNQYRTGTLWLRRSDMTILQWNGTEWVDVAEHIAFRDGSTTVTLQEFYTSTTAKLSSVMPRYTYSGHFVTTNPGHISVPDAIATAITAGGYINILRPILYKNGLLIDPRLVSFSSGVPITVELDPSIDIHVDDTFTVIIERFDIFNIAEVLA